MNQPVSNTTDLEARIEGSIDKDAMALTEISSSAGGLAFKDMGQVMEFAKLMSVAKQAVPRHLRGQPGACMAVSLQALNWRMDPFAVANKSYMVNDRIAYEAQLIQAVIEQRAPIKGRIKGSYEGEGKMRVCVLRVISIEDGDEIVYRSPEIGSITTKNSPLWKSDPDQQLWYYSARAMCRRHFPDVLLGVYEKEEIAQASPLRDVTPKAGGWADKALKARAPEPETITQESDDTKQQNEPAHTIDGEIMPDEGSAGHWTDDVDTGAGFPGSDDWKDGVSAFEQGAPLTDCPHEDNMEAAHDWVGGYLGARKAAG